MKCKVILDQIAKDVGFTDQIALPCPYRVNGICKSPVEIELEFNASGVMWCKTRKVVDVEA